MFIMFVFRKKLLFILFFATICNAYADKKWISVGDDFFYDANSQKRNGDIGSVQIRIDSAIGTFEADCKNKIVLTPTPWKDNKFDASDVISKIAEKACAKKYEFWK